MKRSEIKKIIYTVIVIAICWVAFIGFLEITEANTWMPFEAFRGGVIAGILMSIGILVSTIYSEIKGFTKGQRDKYREG